LSQTKYPARHNAELKILYFELLKDVDVISATPPWHSPALLQPLYENQRAKAFWDVPMHAESTELRANRVEARIIDNKAKKVLVLETSCPLMENRKLKDLKKTQKYAPLRWELKKQYPGYAITQVKQIFVMLKQKSSERKQCTCYMAISMIQTYFHQDSVVFALNYQPMSPLFISRTVM